MSEGNSLFVRSNDSRIMGTSRAGMLLSPSIEIQSIKLNLQIKYIYLHRVTPVVLTKVKMGGDFSFDCSPISIRVLVPLMSSSYAGSKAVKLGVQAVVR